MPGPPSRSSTATSEASPAGGPLRIGRVGADGDGVAVDGRGRTVFIPYTLPGECVAGAAGAVLSASAERVTPPCPHFAPPGGGCGGCTLQHWADAPYAAWKTELVRAALQRAGYAEPSMAPLVRSAPRTRRRVDLALRRGPGGLALGLHRRHSESVVDLHECHVVAPALLAVFAPLRRAFARLDGLRRQGSAILNLLDGGPDLLLRTDGALTTADRTRLAALAAAAGIGRIAWSQGLAPGPLAVETACQLRPAVVTFSGVPVAAPPGAFLQATSAGERAIVEAVLACLPPRLAARAHAVELFAGIGTISLALAAQLRVLAFEADAAAVGALRAAAPPGRLVVTQRDLVRQPLGARELAGAALVVLDPPYAGAAAQMATLAASGVPRIAYVSCNPAALARDAAVLHAAGYALERCTPVDQFLWSARVESVCCFSRRRRT